ncbi:pseudaminic acid biosynthesis-associated methylase [Solirubrobacter pauli]|uniref:Pseudaminic acid biosynthesis-associated methylase n=1 Tax=Solirubrobacter pauli TaxID=166793 RepID=A0A660LDM5_9ACTN|nr:pseudaminic acid biosynthesis-associated methylase [Solirubrobacter pauli]RKQ92345.1 pseudaminic acid biosynthesis-associated methylase [Solirubrobacter pauli]
MSESGEVERLEALWRDDFGDRYVERNRAAAEHREPFWKWLHEAFPFESVLEVGCNLGGNLHWLAQLVDPTRVVGVDINAQALREVRQTLPDVNAVKASARSLPFRDAQFDLTFTTTVLIHQPPDALPIVMNEVVRTSRRYVLCGEYHADELEEVPYRGERGALFKRDWGALYQHLFPELKLLDKRFEAAQPDGSGWDDVTFWLFEKR